MTLAWNDCSQGASAFASDYRTAMLRLQRTAVTAAEVDGIVTTCFPLVRDGLEFDCGPEAFSQRASIYSAALSMLDLELHLSLTANIIVIIIIINTNIVEALPPVQLPAYTLPRTVSRTLGRTDIVTRALSILRFFLRAGAKK